MLICDISFVFDGLSYLMESLLIANARHLRTVDDFGVKKMLRNILALQQNIKTIAQESQHADFERAKRYYSLFTLAPRVSFSVCSEPFMRVLTMGAGLAGQGAREAGVQL